MLVNDAPQAAVVFEDDRAAAQGVEAEAAIGEGGGSEEFALLEVVVRLGGKRVYFTAVIEYEGFLPGRDQDAPFVVRVRKQQPGVLVGCATGNHLQFIACNFLQANAGLGSVDAAADFRERFKASLGYPDLHALAVPAEEARVGSKEVPLGSNQNLPDIAETAMLRRDFLDQRDVLQRSVGVRLEVAENRPRSPPRSYPQRP